MAFAFNAHFISLALLCCLFSILIYILGGMKISGRKIKEEGGRKEGEMRILMYLTQANVNIMVFTCHLHLGWVNIGKILIEGMKIFVSEI
jgi:hypothetical protein